MFEKMLIITKKKINKKETNKKYGNQRKKT